MDIRNLEGDIESLSKTATGSYRVTKPRSVNTYRIFHDGLAKGPYTIAQLRSMWASGHLTADALYREEGASAWEPIHSLALDAAIQPIVSAPPPVLPRPSLPA